MLKQNPDFKVWIWFLNSACWKKTPHFGNVCSFKSCLLKRCRTSSIFMHGFFRCCCFSLGRGVKMPVTHALSDAQKRSVQSTNATKSYHGSQCQNPMSIPWTLGWNHDRCRLALEGQRLTSDKMAICFYFVLLLLVYTYFHLQQLYQIKSKSINNQPIKTFSFDSYYF